MKFLMNEVISALDCRDPVESALAPLLPVHSSSANMIIFALSGCCAPSFPILRCCGLALLRPLNKSFSFEIMVVVNVYKLYSTCIKLPSCIRILCKSFHYFFKGLIQNG